MSRVRAALALAAALGTAAAVAQPLPDIDLRLLDGGSTRLAELSRGEPLLVVLYYTRCSGVCTPFLLALAEAERALGSARTRYRVLALSFDPDDGAGQVRAHAAGLRLLERPHWTFALAAPHEVAALGAAMGHWIRLDAARARYDHPALIGAVRDGRLLRVLAGHPPGLRALRELNWELQGRYVPVYSQPGRSALLGCLHYDPDSGRSRPGWGLALLVLPALTALLATAALFGRARTVPGRAGAALQRRTLALR